MRIGTFMKLAPCNCIRSITLRGTVALLILSIVTIVSAQPHYADLIPVSDLYARPVPAHPTQLTVKFILLGSYSGSFSYGGPEIFYSKAHTSPAAFSIVKSTGWKPCTINSTRVILEENKPPLVECVVTSQDADILDEGFLIVMLDGTAYTPEFGANASRLETSFVAAPFPTNPNALVETLPGTQVPITITYSTGWGMSDQNVSQQYYTHYPHGDIETQPDTTTYAIPHNVSFFTIDYKDDPLPGANWKVVKRDYNDRLEVEPRASLRNVSFRFSRYNQTYLSILVRGWSMVDFTDPVTQEPKTGWFDQWSGVIRRM